MKFDFDEDINIDLTPLIDVIFMLLIFFIMTTTFSKPVIDIMLPASKTAEKAGSETKEIVITVSNKGDIYYGENIISANELEKILKDNPDKILNMFIDKTAPFQSFVHIVDIAKKEREGRFIISTDIAERQ
ncbi:MAG: biopolymer transporter ExbD [Candidatus Mucispirillum faecigallinarum]|uniref:Biopolymer transporter ExbD n=1 Tax=Candidatus Mucispirillum faecigallinarum TaxID=2838699 RepID=A0A9D2GUA5_9BACT|nr:biopolymer transporter ExbD [Mucispirillum sp.]MDY5050544.1 biopolymer transporter ExbD [Candidatus Mucispirillum faecigallinarum]HIZ89507.1 biopolymer transporter ExbD [Candidatus Mucispirillum faecigallinarum]